VALCATACVADYSGPGATKVATEAASGVSVATGGSAAERLGRDVGGVLSACLAADNTSPPSLPLWRRATFGGPRRRAALLADCLASARRPSADRHLR